MSKHQITVLMAVHNGEKTIRRAIESILSQTFRDFEFLIVDDCSTDNTVDIIKSYGDKRIKLHLNDVNVGQTKSLNIGLGLIESEYVARMDADDYSFPGRLGKQCEFIKQHPEYAVVGTDCLVVDEFGNKKSISRGCVEQEDIILKMLYGSPINHVSVLLDLNSVKDVGGYRPEFIIAADFDLWSRLIRKGYKLTTIPETLTAYTVSGDSYSYRSVPIKNKEVVDIVYENIRFFSDYVISKEDVELTMQMFLGEVASMSEENVLKGQLLFKNIVDEIKLELCQKINTNKIESILSNNHYLAAYHLILEERLSDARHLITRFVLNNGLNSRSFIIYLLTFVKPKLVKKLNYYKSKYL